MFVVFVLVVVLSVVVVLELVGFWRFCDLVVAGISGWVFWFTSSLLGRGGTGFDGLRVFIADWLPIAALDWIGG